ncbi:tumor necrosis factor receptor superfamily member 10A-like isoform 2-T2 [Erethizon dorsatum]
MAPAHLARDARAGRRPAPGLQVTSVLTAFLLVVVAEQVITSEAHEPAVLERWELSPPDELCPAGSYLSEKSRQCEKCEEGVDYTSYPNRLPSCISCRVCAREENEVYPCNRTTNTVCYCKEGTFREEGSPEFCRKCQTSCPDGKVMVSPCTPWSDLKCMDKESDWALPIMACVAVIVLVLVVAVCVWKFGCWKTLPDRWSILSRWPGTQALVQCLKSRTPREELLHEAPASLPERPCSPAGCGQDSERRVLINPSRVPRGSESQDNDHNEVLSGMVSLSSPVFEHETEEQPQDTAGVTEQSPGNADCLRQRPAEAERSPVRRKLLVPGRDVDPSEALRKIFSYCTDVVDFNSWDQVMREMGLTPNEIYLARTCNPSDPLYEMLQKWLNKTGFSASINALLDALEKLGETLAREKIEKYAVNCGNFIYQEHEADSIELLA